MNIPESFTISTKRCRLRIIADRDLPQVFSASRFPGFNDGMVWDPPEKEEDLREFQNKYLKGWKAGREYTFTIECITTSNFVGRISIRKKESPGTWDLGFWVHPSLQNNGYMSEVVPAVINFGFTRLNVELIQASHAIWNKASRAVIEKAGLRYSSSNPEGFLKHGQWVAVDVLSLSRSEWEKSVPKISSLI
jgi:ribosomal-protein-alanine N-acetyltransferase